MLYWTALFYRECSQFVIALLRLRLFTISYATRCRQRLTARRERSLSLLFTMFVNTRYALPRSNGSEFSNCCLRLLCHAVQQASPLFVYAGRGRLLPAPIMPVFYHATPAFVVRCTCSW